MGTNKKTIETRDFIFDRLADKKPASQVYNAWFRDCYEAGPIPIETDQYGNFKILSNLDINAPARPIHERRYPFFYEGTIPYLSMQIQLRAALYPEVPRIRTIGIPGGEKMDITTDDEYIKQRETKCLTGGINPDLAAKDIDAALRIVTRDNIRLFNMMLRWLSIGVFFDPELRLDPINLNQGRDFLSETHSYDAVFVNFICNDKKDIEVGVTHLNRTPYHVSKDHSAENWRNRIERTGAWLVGVFGPTVREVTINSLDSGTAKVPFRDNLTRYDMLVDIDGIMPMMPYAPIEPLVPGDKIPHLLRCACYPAQALRQMAHTR